MPSLMTANWTSATALNTALQMGVSTIAGSQVNLTITGSLTGGTLVFEVSDDGVTFFTVVGIVQSTFSIFTNWQTSFGAPASFQFNVNGWNFFQVRLSQVLTGTGTLNVGISPALASQNVIISAVQQNGANLQMSAAPVTVAGGAFSSNFINATGAAASLKNTSGNLYGFTLTNNTAAVAFVEFFDTAAVPTLGTTAVVFCVEIPASQSITLQPCEIALKNFVNGIGFAVTTTENGATTASVTGMVFWK